MTTATLGSTRHRLRCPAATVVVWASWPVGFVLIMAHSLGGLLDPWPFALLTLAYGAAVVPAVRTSSRVTGGGLAPQLLVLSGPCLFVLAGLTGPPTAAAPGKMLLNAVVLAMTAVILLSAATALALNQPRLELATALALLALYVGSAGWMINLVSRWAVVLSGAAPLQLAVEGQAWMANVYLRGLAGEPAFLTYLLVLMDLLQLVYVVLTFSCFGLLTRSAVRGRQLAARSGHIIAVVALALAAIVVIAAASAAWVEPFAVVTAWTAFVLTIPFVSTLVPYLLGGALLTRGASRS